jgi:pimeloyl-ACP methyl ester carboxylesterase
MLALTGSEPDSWGPLPEPLILDRVAHVAKVERAVVEGAGHFVHMERPAETAARVLAFLERG